MFDMLKNLTKASIAVAVKPITAAVDMVTMPACDEVMRVWYAVWKDPLKYAFEIITADRAKRGVKS